jgi:hypothetical protein
MDTAFTVSMTVVAIIAMAVMVWMVLASTGMFDAEWLAIPLLVAATIAVGIMIAWVAILILRRAR